MSALDITRRLAPAGNYGTVNVFLETMDELDAVTRQRAALGFLNRLPDPDDAPDTLPIRRLFLAIMEVAITDGVLSDFDAMAQPIGLTVRHLRRLIELREDAEQRLAIAAHHVRPADLAALFDGVGREQRAAGLQH